MIENRKLKWKRFIVQVHNTYYLSLPQEYVQSMKIGKDVEIDIELNTDGSLTLTPKEAN